MICSAAEVRQQVERQGLHGCGGFGANMTGRLCAWAWKWVLAHVMDAGELCQAVAYMCECDYAEHGGCFLLP